MLKDLDENQWVLFFQLTTLYQCCISMVWISKAVWISLNQLRFNDPVMTFSDREKYIPAVTAASPSKALLCRAD